MNLRRLTPRESKIKLSRSQRDFVHSQHRGTIYLAGAGSGKSYALVYKAVLSALNGLDGAIISFSLNNIRDNLVPLFRQVLTALNLQEGSDYKITKSPAVDIEIKGTKILLRTGSDPDKLRGISVKWFLIDEARELTRYLFDVMLSRLRGGDNLKWSIVTTTRGKDWVYNIIKQEDLLDIFDQQLEEIENTYIRVIRTTLYDSPWATDEQIKEQEQQFTTSFAKQELLALIVDGEGELIKPDWFKIASLTKPIQGVRFWDLAVTTNNNSDYSVGCLMSVNDGKYYINDIRRVKLQYPDLKKLMIATAIEDGYGIAIGIEVAGQQRAILDDLRRERILHNYTFKQYRPTKDKITRAYPIASQIELGNVTLNNGPWVRDFLDECSTFSAENVAKGSVKDDQVDAMTGAYYLLNKRTQVGLTNLPI